MKTRFFAVVGTLLVLALLGVFVACSGSKTLQSQNSMGTVNVSVSDPPTCSASTGGGYSHVWVTIKDVKIHQSASAGANDAGWVDLTPNLSSAPQQVDLLGIANNTCFLAMLGSNVELQAGTYQQIRVFLSDNSDASKLGANNCANGTGVNCVQLADTTFHALDLTSETSTGIKIPSGQLAGGAFTIAAGEVKDLNIDFDACASIVAQAGHFRLKPVLHAGEVKLTSTSISGQLVLSGTTTPLVGGKAVVALEQNVNGTETLIMEATPDSNGNWVLCPVPPGTYDVVAVAVDGANIAYAATITTGVQPGNALGAIPMVPDPGALSDASITGNINTSTGSAGITEDVTLAAVQTVTLSSSSVNVIVPLALQSSTEATVTTSNTCGCTAANSNCNSYTLAVPAAWPNVGAFAAGGTTYAQDITTVPVTYSVYGWAFNAGVPTCSTNPTIVNTLAGGGALAVTAAVPSAAADMNFTGCQ
jgi:hypothetical protein